MITPTAIHGLGRLLNQSLLDSLKTESHSHWTLEPTQEPSAKGASNFIMLTISSYDFQILVLLHFDANATSRSYVADALKVTQAELDATRYQDYLSEVGNTFCGMLKRELGQYFPHLGMSTPNILISESLRHLREWHFEHESHLRASTDGGVAFTGSMYVSTDGNLDFVYREAARDEAVAETGELELF